jgi:hypothetical protein
MERPAHGLSKLNERGGTVSPGRCSVKQSVPKKPVRLNRVVAPAEATRFVSSLTSLTGDLPPDLLAQDIEYRDYQRVICTWCGDNAALGRIEIVSCRV